MAKANKYGNEFYGVSADSVANAIKAINDFVASLNAVDYSSSGCFAMSTNAKYDGTYNNGIEYLKGTDIASMVTLCNSCSSVLGDLQTYISKYSTYEKAYETYNTAYETYNTAYKSWTKDKKKTKPTEPSDADIKQKETELKELAKSINSASF